MKNATMKEIRNNDFLFWQLACHMKGTKTWMVFVGEFLGHKVGCDRYGHYYLDGKRMTLCNIARKIGVSEKAMKNIVAFLFCNHVQDKLHSVWTGKTAFFQQEEGYVEVSTEYRSAKLPHRFSVAFYSYQYGDNCCVLEA